MSGDLNQYDFMAALCDRNETLFFKLLVRRVPGSSAVVNLTVQGCDCVVACVVSVILSRALVGHLFCARVCDHVMLRRDRATVSDTTHTLPSVVPAHVCLSGGDAGRAPY